MKSKFLSLAFLGALSSVPIFAQDKKETPDEKSKPETSCVWKISDDDNTVYLAGSVHLLRDQDLPIPACYQSVYEDSTRLVFEIDMNLMTDMEELQRIRQMGMLEEGDALKKHLKKKTWRLLQKYMKKRTEEMPTFPLFQLEKMKPGTAYITITSIEAMRMGAKAELGLEQTFFDQAKKDAKPSSGLETMEFQLTLFDKIDEDEQDRLMREALESADKMGETLDEMIASWKSGDGEKLNQLISEEMPEGDVLRDVLLSQRNKNWIPEIEKALAGKDNVMFIVGAGHLVGGDSVVALLREKGMKVEQLSHGSKAVAEVN